MSTVHPIDEPHTTGDSPKQGQDGIPPPCPTGPTFRSKDSIMNRNQLFAAAALAVLGTTSAFAGGEFDPMTGFGNVGQSTVSRAEVRAEYFRARDGGEMVSF